MWFCSGLSGQVLAATTARRKKLEDTYKRKQRPRELIAMDVDDGDVGVPRHSKHVVKQRLSVHADMTDMARQHGSNAKHVESVRILLLGTPTR